MDFSRAHYASYQRSTLAMHYFPMRRGFFYLVAIVVLATRNLLAHWVTTSKATEFCIEALDEAITKYGRPEIFNTDPGSQFTSDDFIEVLWDNGSGATRTV